MSDMTIMGLETWSQWPARSYEQSFKNKSEFKLKIDVRFIYFWHFYLTSPIFALHNWQFECLCHTRCFNEIARVFLTFLRSMRSRHKSVKVTDLETMEQWGNLYSMRHGCEVKCTCVDVIMLIGVQFIPCHLIISLDSIVITYIALALGAIQFRIGQNGIGKNAL